VGVHGLGARGESGAIYILTDSPTVSEKYIVEALSTRGLATTVINVAEMPIYRIRGTAILRMRNPYTAVAYGVLAERSINPPAAIASALNRLGWLPKFGPPHAVVSSDFAVEKVEVEKPWLLMTAWRLDIDGFVTSVEGAKSVLEHRFYMRNPLARVSVVVPKPQRTYTVFATAKAGEGVAKEVLKHLGLLYAKVTLGEYGREVYVLDVDPIPPLDKREAVLVAELV